MRNSLAPGYIQLHYTVADLGHVHTIPVKPVAPAGDATLLIVKDGSNIDWTTGIADYVSAINGVFSAASATFDFADLFTQADADSAPVFQSTVVIGVAGTNAGASVEAGQLVFSWRSSAGGRAKTQLMETAFPDDFIQAPSDFGTDLAAIDTYVRGSSSIVIARDGGTLSSAIRAITKENDKLRKIRLNL